MDTSETYIKMCERAEEIQLANIDFKTNKNIHQSSVVNGICIVMGDFFYLPEIYTQWFDKDAVWLPRQDQLQEMIGDTPYYNIRNSMFSVLDDFRNYAFATNFKEYIPLTMEQLWLAFVMKEKYGKSWNGEDWIV